MKKISKIIMTLGLLCSVFALAGCNFNAEEEIAGYSFYYKDSENAASGNGITGTVYSDYTYTFNTDGTFKYVWRTVLTSDGTCKSDKYKAKISYRNYEGNYEAGSFEIKFSDVKVSYPVQYVSADGTVKDEPDDAKSTVMSSLKYSIIQKDGIYYLRNNVEKIDYQRLD